MNRNISQRASAARIATIMPDIDLEILSFIRSRLNVVGTSLYLLDTTLPVENSYQRKHVDKIKLELEEIRKCING